MICLTNVTSVLRRGSARRLVHHTAECHLDTYWANMGFCKSGLTKPARGLCNQLGTPLNSSGNRAMGMRCMIISDVGVQVLDTAVSATTGMTMVLKILT